MNFTDIFIRRPVLALTVSLLILALGLRAGFTLPVLQYPRTENAVVEITTAYYGADADVVAGFITTPLENAIAQANGIDYISSVSQNGMSTITATLRLNHDSNKALSEISAKVDSVKNQLPPESQQPVLSMSVGATMAAMYIGFRSDKLEQNSITDYLLRVVQPQMQAVEGVQTAEILGAQTFALRAWLDPEKLAAYDMTAADVSRAMTANHYISALGKTKGQMVQVDLNASTDLRSLDEFRRLIIREKDGAIIRLEDVASVTLGADNYEARVGFDGEEAVYMGIQIAPTANLLEVIGRVRDKFPQIQAELPEGLEGAIVYDSTKFVNSAINEVVRTLIEAMLIVTVVIFLFLGSPRSVLIPVIAIPLSLVGAFTFMMAFGFSINLLTLLALVLAIGLVVDDAIIVVENVDRHMEEGNTPFVAAMRSARELAGPILAMTIVLVAVYVPIGFQTGLTGALFTEFAFTLVAAITISMIVALTLSPMMCARFLKPHRTTECRVWHECFVDWLEEKFDRLRRWYERRLDSSLNYLPVTVVFSIFVLGFAVYLYNTSKTELAPQEDQGIVISFNSSAPNATLQQRLLYTREAYRLFSVYPEADHIVQFEIPGFSFGGVVLKPWDERDRTATEILPDVQRDVASLAGINGAAFQPPSLPGARGMPIQFVIKTTDSYERLMGVSDAFLEKAQKLGLFMFLNSDLKIDAPQSTVQIDREKAAMLGLSMADIGAGLSAMLGGGYTNYFSFSGRAYKVIPQVEQQSRLNGDQLSTYYIRTAGGESVPLSTVATVTTKAVPQSLNRFQQMNAATVSGVMYPGLGLGDVLESLETLAKEELPQGYTVDFGGQSRQFMQEKSGFVMIFLFALIIIFLALSAQFESFRDPITILISVPMAMAGALLFISMGGMIGASLNIYTQVGLVTLMGLISKHGILIAEFANKLMAEGMSKRQAIVHASGIRLRPILMTTAATVMGVLPLVLASGAGAESRFNMGLVIVAGLSIGTLFTLFVHPAVVLMIGEDHSKRVSKAQALEAKAEEAKA